MHIAAVSTLLFAALAAADSHGHARRFHHRRAINETMTSAMTTPPTTEEAAPLTTLTVHQTIVHTITNCGKNITETTCGGKDATVEVVTKTIDLTTIVCPVTEADAISSSVIASAGSTAPVVVEATQTAVPVEESSVSPNGPEPTPNGPEPTPVGDAESTVLSYTLGPESSQTVITTTYFNTKTASDYVTKYITYDNSPETVTVIAPVIPERITTLSSTTTSTRTVIVPAGPTASDSDVSPEGSNPACPGGESCPETPSGSDNEVPTDNKTPSGSDNEVPTDNKTPAEDCPAPVTVTETIALSTVTVTATPAPSAIENGGATTTDCPKCENPETTGVPAVPAPVEDNTEETKPVAKEPEPVIVDDVIFVIPTKYENATAPHPTGNAGPSGFITQSRPSGTGAPIEPAPTAKAFFRY